MQYILGENFICDHVFLAKCRLYIWRFFAVCLHHSFQSRRWIRGIVNRCNPWKFNSESPWKYAGPQGGVVFQPSFFQGFSLLNFEGVSLLMDFWTLDLVLSNSYSGDSRGFPDAMQPKVLWKMSAFSTLPTLRHPRNFWSFPFVDQAWTKDYFSSTQKTQTQNWWARSVVKWERCAFCVELSLQGQLRNEKFEQKTSRYTCRMNSLCRFSSHANHITSGCIEYCQGKFLLPPL